MKRFTFVCLLLLVAVFAFATGAAAECDHDYQYDASKVTADTHTLVCTLCGDEQEPEAHSRYCYEEVCDVCSAPYTGMKNVWHGTLEDWIPVDEEFHDLQCVYCKEGIGARYSHTVACDAPDTCIDCGATNVTRGDLSHDYQLDKTENTTNTTTYTYVCSVCGDEEVSIHKHIRDCGEEVCLDCEEPYTGDYVVHFMNYDETVSSDKTHHWYSCTNCDFKEAELHSAACDDPSKCYACGATNATLSVSHSYYGLDQSEITSTTHTLICETCGDRKTEEHTRDCFYDHCSVCGTFYSGDNIEHWAERSLYEFDATHHWYVCVDCEEVFDKVEHFDSNGKGYCVCGVKKNFDIVEQPKSVTVKEGDTATVSVEATGDGLTYAWYVKAPGATDFVESAVTESTYSAEMSSDVNGTELYCVVTDEYGNTITSDTVTIKMQTPLAITAQPESVTVKNGETARLSIEATGDGLTYAWYVKAVGSDSFTKSSLTGNIYTVGMTSARNGNQVYCVVTDEYGNTVTSDTVTLKMQTPLVITAQPESVSVKEGEAVSASVTATGDGLTYAWYVKAPGATDFSASAVTESTYSTEMTGDVNGTELYCVVTDEYGNTITSDTVTLKMQKPLAITAQPESVTVKEGVIARVTVSATGDGLTYAWYVKTVGTDTFTKSSNTRNSYTVEMTSARNGNQVYCVVTDEYGNTVTSDTVTLKMQTPLVITAQPKSATAQEGEAVSASVTATGDGLTYAWYVKAPGATDFSASAVTESTYSAEMTGDVNGTELYCVVTDEYGNTVTSDTVTLKMQTPLAITTQPESVTVKNGVIARVTVSATGDGLTYAWYVKTVGTDTFTKSSNTRNSYTVEMTSARNGNQVYCVVTDQYGNSVTSDTVTISMEAAITITTQPQSVTVDNGETARVTVAATGEGLTYTWYVKAVGSSAFNKSSISSSTYTVAMNSARNGNQLYCVVTDNAGNSVTTNTVTIKMNTTSAPLAITTQPKSVTVANGETAKVTIAASGEGLTYTWYVKAVGTTAFKKSTLSGSTYSVAMNSARNGNQLYCVVKDKFGNTVTTNTVTIKMSTSSSSSTSLAITTQPKSVTVANGATAKVTIAARGEGLTYTWYVKAVGTSAFKKSTLSGSTYSVAMNSARNGNQLYCVVKDKNGNTVKSNTVTIKMKTPLAITTQPKSVTVAKYSTAKVSVVAKGDGLTYTWYVKAVGTSSFKKSSNTGSTYSVTMNSDRNGNQVYCVVKDKYGSTVKTNTVTLKMK